MTPPPSVAPCGYRAVTTGPTTQDWAVVSPHGEVLWRGHAVVAARIAAHLPDAGA